MSRLLDALRVLLGRTSTATDEDDPDRGPEAIARARAQLTTDTDPTEARIGEARLEDYSFEFTTDLKAVIPVHTHKYEDPAPLLLDPDGDELAEFCDAYGIEVHELGDLEGETVPLAWSQAGEPCVDWYDLTTGGDGDE
jgi:hypothetical protein